MKKTSKYETNDNDLNFDFDEWVTLYEHDPEAFESRRLKWNETIVNQAPPAYQRRLSGLVFQINMEKRRSKNAMDSCIRISGLMWNKFHELKTELQELMQEPGVPGLPSTNRNKGEELEEIDIFQADIIDFASYQKV